MSSNDSVSNGKQKELSSFQKKLIQDISVNITKLERVVFNSNPMKRTYTRLRMPLAIREPGCWFSAQFGQGKTSAASYCVSALRREFPGLPVYLINEYVLPSNELRSFFIKALMESGHAVAKGTYVEKLRNRLASYWAELSCQSPLRCVVLIIDEGQALRSTDLFVLRDLGNDIASKNGSLQTFVFGESPKLDLLVQKFGNTLCEESVGGAFDRLLGGHKLTISNYENIGDWESLFVDIDNRRLAELGNKSVREAIFGHLDSSKLIFKNEVQRFHKALISLSTPKGGEPNLRRIFVGIRHVLLSVATETITNESREINAIPPEFWLRGLTYANTQK